MVDNFPDLLPDLKLAALVSQALPGLGENMSTVGEQLSRSAFTILIKAASRKRTVHLHPSQNHFVRAGHWERLRWRAGVLGTSLLFIDLAKYQLLLAAQHAECNQEIK